MICSLHSETWTGSGNRLAVLIRVGGAWQLCFQNAYIRKSITLTRILYFSNIYSNALYLYSALMSVIYHLIALIVTHYDVIVLLSVSFS